MNLKADRKYRQVFLIVIFFFFTEGISAQFYNGHQMTFGKNRVQYRNRYWRYHRFDRFDVYFYKNGDSLSRKVARIAKKEIPEIENFFGYGLQKRLIFLCYKNLSSFRESNVGYDTGNENSNIGGTTQIIDNKIFIYYDGSFEGLEKQITAGITKVLINDMLYSGSYGKRFANSTLIELPDWYEKGLISYLSEEWSFKIENRIKDGFQSKKFKKINHLTGEDAVYAGHSFWYFIGETYGKDVIPNIIYMTRINKSTDSGFKFVLGLSIKELSPLWKDFYKKRFNEQINKQNLPDKKFKVLKAKRNRLFQNAKISPDGRYIAYVSNESGKYRVCIYDKKTKKVKTIRKKGHALDQIPDYSFPVLAWHPSGKILTFFTEEQGYLKMYLYHTDSGKLQRRNILFFDKILSASYSADGFLLAVSAVIDGQTDIFIYNVAAGNFDRVTDDAADDFNPSFINNSSEIIFSSDRNQTEAGKNEKDLFIYNLKTGKISQLTKTPYFDEDLPVELGKNKYMSLTDKTGIINRQIISYDSTVSYVDTTVHYRYFTDDYLVSDYSRNINEYDVNKENKSLAEIIFRNNRYSIYNEELKNLKIRNYKKTIFRKLLTSKIRYADSMQHVAEKEEIIRKRRIDSLRKHPPLNLLHPDSIPVDVNNYIFETERHIKYYQIHPIIDTLTEKKDTSGFLPTFNYLTNFYTNHLTQQVDFGFLNNSYQTFTGGAYYFNPGMNIFTKLGIYDLFEDYRITGGFRLGVNLNSFEYLFSLENLKHRVDKQYVFHRQTYTGQYGDDSTGYYFYAKIISNELMYILKYPFNQVAAVKATFSLRYDKGIYLSTDMATLAEPPVHQFFSGIKLEYIYDDTRNLGLNLFDGTRFKLFTEYYQEVDQEYTNLLTIGGDFRFYKRIHRDLIFASRIAGGSSFGKSKLLYYLGGVDNWYVLNPKKMQFDYSVDINNKESYVYQAVATNMRGFVQNARNGTNFFVINNEIRFPIVKYLANRPLNSSLLNNFQIVGFVDAGSAWSGLTPKDPSNAYNTETVKTGPVTVVIDKNRSPVIFGYGFGVRTKIFGYFVRLDWAWGVDNNIILPRIFYFSLNLDF